MIIIGVTIGDPTGIGPEIIEKVLTHNNFTCKIILYGALPRSSLRDNIPKISHSNEIFDNDAPLLWFPLMQDQGFIPGHPSRASGQAAYLALQKASDDALRNVIDAIITAPISKHYIQLTYPDFIGHTEFFAHQADNAKVVMSFFSEKLNVALLTTHCALSDVSKHLSVSMATNKILVIHASLKKYFHIQNPKLALLGLNPHAGENGAFGKEEVEVLSPAIKLLQTEGVDIRGPFPADTFFAGKYQDYDMIISPFHDQALVPFKMLAFDTGVNVTLGLPYVRTSVDHGTAFDIAGKNKASETSLLSALHLAEKMLS